jgi:hypothetical protein
MHVSERDFLKESIKKNRIIGIPTLSQQLGITLGTTVHQNIYVIFLLHVQIRSGPESRGQ